MMIDEDTHSHLTRKPFLNYWSGINENVIRTPETHPLTWRLRDDKQPVWLDEYRSKTATKARVRR